MSIDDEIDLKNFLAATSNAKAALMRVYDRAEKLDDGYIMSTALRVHSMLQDSNRVMTAICSEN